MSNNEEMTNKVKAIEKKLATVTKAFYELSLAKENQKTKFWKIMSLILLLICIISNLIWTINRINMEKVVETTTENITYDFDGIEQNAESSNSLQIIGDDKIGNTEN